MYLGLVLRANYEHPWDGFTLSWLEYGRCFHVLIGHVQRRIWAA